MKDEKKEIPYGHVWVFCKDCGENYFANLKDLKHKTDRNNGCYPCDKCGSHNTTWLFRQ